MQSLENREYAIEKRRLDTDSVVFDAESLGGTLSISGNFDFGISVRRPVLNRIAD
jgi:hypothetical protein